MRLHDLEGVTVVRVTSTSGRVEMVAEPRTDMSVSAGAVSREGSSLTVDAGTNAVVVRVPEGVSVMVGSDSGRVTMTGKFDAVGVASESGRIFVDEARSVDVRSTSGRIDVGRCLETCRARSGSGRVQVGETGNLDVHTESGRISVGRTAGPVVARATQGRIDIGIGAPSDVSAETMTGKIVLSLAEGLGAQVDLESSGRVDNAAPTGPDCHIVARSVTGRVQVQSQ